MKTHISEMWQDITGFFKDTWSDIKKLKQNSPAVFFGLLIAFVLVTVLGLLLVRYFIFAPSSDRSAVPVPTIFTLAPTQQLQATAQPTSTPTPLPTNTPIPSNLWVVNQLLDPVNGVLVVEFKNISTGEIKKGLCQSPHDPEPIVGDIFVAEVIGDHILLSPTIAGTSQIDLNSKVQRFIFIR